MRKVLEHLREYDLDEIKLLCRKYQEKERSTSQRSRRRKSTRRSGRKAAKKKNST